MHPDSTPTSTPAQPAHGRKAHSGFASATALPTAVLAAGLAAWGLLDPGAGAGVVVSLGAIAVWALLLLDDRPPALRLACAIAAGAAVLQLGRSFGSSDAALAGVLGSACAAAAGAAWARSRHETSGTCQTTLMLCAAACGYLGFEGVVFPEARSQSELAPLAVLLPLGMSWLMLHRMDWSRPPSIGTLCAAAAIGFVASAVLGMLMGAPFLAGFRAGQVPMTAAGAACVFALGFALLAVQFGNRRLAIAAVTVPVTLALHALSTRGVAPPPPSDGNVLPYWLPGHIAPAAAATVLATSLLFGLGNLLARYRIGATLIWVGGLAALLVTTIALLAFVAGVPSEIAGGARSGSIPTLLATWVIAFGMLFVRTRQPDAAPRIARNAPLVVGLVVAVGATWLANAQYRQDQIHLGRDAELGRREVESTLQAAFETRGGTLKRFARRLLATPAGDRARMFDLEVEQAVAAPAGLHSMHWLDRAFATLRSAPGTTDPASGADAGQALARAVAEAAANGTGAYGPVRTAPGTKVVLFVHAVADDDAGDNVLVAAYDLDRVADLALREVGHDVDVRLLFDDAAATELARGANLPRIDWSKVPASPLRLGGVEASLQVAAGDGGALHGALPAIMLWCGLVIATLLSLTLRFALIGRHRAEAAEAANAALLRAAAWDQAQGRTLSAIATDARLDEILALATATYEARFPAARCAVHLRDGSGGAVLRVIAPRLPEAYRAHWNGIAPGEGAGAAGTAMLRQSLVVSADVESDALWGGHRAVARRARIGSACAAPILDADGRVCGAFEACHESARTPDAEEREALSAAASLVGLALDRDAARSRIEESRERFLSLFERSPSVVLALDLEGRVVDCNAQTSSRTGIPRERLLLDRFDSTVAESHRDVARRHFASAAAGAAQTFDTEVVVPRSGRREVTATLIPIAVSGDIVGVFAIVADVTERNRVARELQQALGDLRQRNRELQDFAFVATHDLQEPLRKIQAFSDRVLQRFADALPAAGQDYLQRIDAAAHRMQVLIDDLLAYSRVSTQGQPFDDVDLQAVADDVLSDLEVRIEETGADVIVGELPTIRGDRTQLRQLLQNLVANALKFRAEGRPPSIRILAARDPDPQQTVLTVEDNGIGFDPRHAERIFVPFQRLHGADVYGGTGIGLAVVRRIVERHHGTVRAFGRPGEGARFEVRLPLAAEADRSAREQAEARTAVES